MSGLVGIPKKGVKEGGVIWPARREFIKRAPIVFAGAAALAALPKVAAASLLKRSSNNIAHYPVTQPALAAFNGKNTLAFYDGFDSINTIDVNNTLAPGFNWYGQLYGFAGYGSTVFTLPANYFSVANSILTFNNIEGGAGGGNCFLASAGYTGSSAPRSVGYLLPPNGCYAETSIKITPSGSGGCQTQNPKACGMAWWMRQFQYLLDTGDNANTDLPLVDLDIWQTFGGGTQYPYATIQQFNANDNNITYNSGILNNFPGSGGSIDWMVFHKIGMLWLTQAQNNGTGTFKFYFDDVLVAGSTFTYSSTTVPSPFSGTTPPAGSMSRCEFNAGGYDILLGMVPGGQVDYVQIWQ